MKKLMVTLIGVLGVVLLVSSCGTDVDVNWDEFFNEYHSECVQLCETCAEWSDRCEDVIYSIQNCIDGHWFRGDDNIHCGDANEVIKDLIFRNDCLSKDSRCFPKEY